MKTLVYIGLLAVVLALAMFVSGPTIKAHGKAWRAQHRTISAPIDTRGARHWSARI